MVRSPKRHVSSSGSASHWTVNALRLSCARVLRPGRAIHPDAHRRWLLRAALRAVSDRLAPLRLRKPRRAPRGAATDGDGAAAVPGRNGIWLFVVLTGPVGFLQNFTAISFDALVQSRTYYQFILVTLLATGLFQIRSPSSDSPAQES